MIGTLLIVSTLVVAQAVNSNISDFLTNTFQRDFNVATTPDIDTSWNIQYLAYETGITTNIVPLNETILQLDITNTNGGGYKFNSVVCNISGVNNIELFIKNNAGQYTSIGNANYGLLTNYGIPNTWCSETNGKGFILFSSGSKDVGYRLKFPTGLKTIKIFTGSNSEEVLVSYIQGTIINEVLFINFTNPNIGLKNNATITAVKYH